MRVITKEVTWKMVKRQVSNRRGQSILEYLVIATVIVAALLAVRGTVSTHVSSLFTNASTKVGSAATSLGNLTFEGSTTTTTP